jgi:hypothetical protein
MVVMKQHLVQASAVEHFPAHQTLHEMALFRLREVCRIRLLSFCSGNIVRLFRREVSRFSIRLIERNDAFDDIEVVPDDGVDPDVQYLDDRTGETVAQRFEKKRVMITDAQAARQEDFHACPSQPAYGKHEGSKFVD